MAHARAADRLFDGLLKLLPQEFRDRHGREIVQVFRAERADAATRRERAGVWVHTAIGVLLTAPCEHLSILRNDLRFAARALGRNPVFAGAAMLTLALPIGAITAMFGLLNTLAFQPLPFPDVDRMLIVDEISTGSDGNARRLRASTATFDAVRARTDLFEGVAAHRRRTFALAGRDGGERVPAAMISPGWSRLVPAPPVRGRLFTGDEETGGSGPVAIVSERVWDAYLSIPRNIGAAEILLDGQRHRVVGVMRDSYRYPYAAEIWLPGTFAFGDRDLLVIARARTGVAIETINRELAADAARLAERSPEARGDAGMSAMSIRRNLLGGADRTAWLLLGSVGLLLLIACANVVHLLFVRVAARQREFCIRGALGANRARQIRQMVTETMVLFAVAATLGLVAAPVLSRVVVLLVPAVLRAQFGVQAIEIDGPVIAFVGAITLGLALLFGFAAAAQAPLAPVTAVLNEDVPASPGGRARRLTRVAIVSQVALALVLVACAFFLVRSYERMRTRDLGFDPSRVLTFQLELTAPSHRAPAARVRAIEAAVAAAQQVPGVVTAAAASVNPVCCFEWGAYLVAEGQAEAPDRRFAVHHREVTPEFFNALGIRFRRGRSFTEADIHSSQPVAIVDHRVADRLWPGQNPLGRRVRMAYEDREHPWRTVVGVTDLVHDNGAFEATWYVPVAQHPDQPSLARMHLMLKTTSDPLALVPGVRRALARVDPLLVPFQIDTMDAQRAQMLSRDRLSAFMLAAFAVFGLLLAVIGIYGVTAHAIERRLPELGIRMAFGASPAEILRSASDRALRLSAAGCLVGVTAAFVVGALLERAIFSTTTADPEAIVAAAAVVAGASLLACVIPAWRAASTVPRVALRRWE